MEKPRVFVSHGAGTDEDVWAVIEAIEAELVGEGFEVFLDRTRIEQGGAWRPAIERELPRCHCGVVVLCKRGVDRPWVIHEAGVLSMRARGEKTFAVVPVLVGDVPLPQGDAWSPANIAERNPIRAAAPAATAREVAEGLAGVKLSYLDAADLQWVTRLSTLLVDLDERALRAAGDVLGTDLRIWPQTAEPARALSYAMMRTRDIGKLFEAAEMLAANDARADAMEIFRDALPHAWIDWDAACAVRDAVEGRRPVVLDATHVETGRMYLCRTTLKPVVATITAVVGEADEADILAEVHAALAQAIFNGPAPAEDICAELAEGGVTLVLPFAPPSREAIGEVTRRFGDVSLLFCGGRRPELVWLEQEGDVEIVEPRVDETLEQLAIRKSKAAGRLRRTVTGGP